MAITTIPGTAQIQDTQIGSKVNVAPRLRELGQARQTFQDANGAVQSSLGIVQEYEERKRKAEEAGYFNKSAIATLSATSTFRHEMKKIPDQQIVENWTKASAAVKQAQTDDPDFAKMSPLAQRALRQNLDKWQAQSTGEFQVAADRLGAQRRNATAVAAKAAFLKTGDPAMKTNATAALQAAVKAGDMTKDQYDFEVKGMDEQLEKNQILNGIDANAYATLQKIKGGGYKNVSEMDLNTLRNQAERQVSYEQRTNAGDMINSYSQSGVPTPDKTLQDAKKAGKISGDFVKTYKAMVARDDYHVAQDKQALLMTRLRDMNLDDSENPEKDAQSVTDEAGSLPPQLQKEIYTLADSRVKAAKKGQERTLHAGQLDLMREAHDESVGRIPISQKTDTEPARRATSVDDIKSMSDEKFAAEFGDNADRDEVTKRAGDFVKAENLRYAKAQKAYVDWSKTKKGSEATPQQAEDERERLGFARYQTHEDVIGSFKAGKISAATCKEILLRQFGIP
jgi:hypothetical protein